MWLQPFAPTSLLGSHPDHCRGCEAPLPTLRPAAFEVVVPWASDLVLPGQLADLPVASFPGRSKPLGKDRPLLKLVPWGQRGEASRGRALVSRVSAPRCGGRSCAQCSRAPRCPNRTRRKHALHVSLEENQPALLSKRLGQQSALRQVPVGPSRTCRSPTGLITEGKLVTCCPR